MSPIHQDVVICFDRRSLEPARERSETKTGSDDEERAMMICGLVRMSWPRRRRVDEPNGMMKNRSPGSLTGPDEVMDTSSRRPGRLPIRPASPHRPARDVRCESRLSPPSSSPLRQSTSGGNRPGNPRPCGTQPKPGPSTRDEEEKRRMALGSRNGGKGGDESWDGRRDAVPAATSSK